jgi:S1-C subfamily serine protease
LTCPAQNLKAKNRLKDKKFRFREMKQKIFKILAIFVLGIFGGIFADQILWPYLVERPLFFKYGLDENPVYVTETKEVIIKENDALRTAIERVEKSVVGIRSDAKEEAKKGSGLIISSDGLVVTLADLVPQGSETIIFVEGEPADFTILKRDLGLNLALIKVEKNNLPTVSFYDTSKLNLGERVFLVGTAFDVEQFARAVNEGIISYFDDESIKTNIFETSIFKGSVLFNMSGEVLGINDVDFWGRVSSISAGKIRTFAGF